MNISITRDNGAMQVTPAPPYLLDYLKYSHRSFEVVRYKRVNKFTTKLLYETDGEGGVYTLHGFFEKICMLITKTNDTYNIIDIRTNLPKINWDRVKQIGLREYQVKDVAEFLEKAKNNSGIINATGGYGKTIMQAVTYAAFNNLNTILAIPLKQVFLQTAAKFKQLFPEKHIGMVGDGSHDISNDITITTFKSLRNCATEKCQLLLVDEIQGTTGEVISDAITRILPIRAFGYTATDKGLFNNADKLIKGLFGERLIHIEYQEAQAQKAVVPCTVYFVSTSDNVMISATTIEGKIKQGIKNCVERNKLISAVCRKVPDNWQTLIFVDHILDHLIKLHKEMPLGTKYIHRESSKTKANSYALSAKQQNTTIAGFIENDFQYLLATDAFRAGVDIPNCRVVVQASGGSSEIEILQEAYRGSRTLPQERQEQLGVTPKTHFILIDFLDIHDPQLESMSNKRMEIYRKQGWTIKTVDSVEQIDWNHFEETQTK